MAHALRVLGTLASFLLCAGGGAAASTGLPAYAFDAPAGWTRTDVDGTIVLQPPNDPGGSAVLVILPTAPRSPDVDAQFAAMRAALENGLGLGAGRDVVQQRQGVAGAERWIHLAVYSSGRGDRQLILLSRADGPAVGTVMLLTTSPAARDRLRDLAVDLFNGMRLAKVALARLSPSTGTAPAAARAGPAGHAWSYRGAGIVGVWTGTRIRRVSNAGFGTEIAVQAWLVFFDDGLVLQSFPEGGLAGLDREAHRARFPDEWSPWTFDGAAGSIRRSGGAAPWTLKLVGPDRLEVSGSPYRRCPDVNGLRLDGTWYQAFGADPGDPDFARRPPDARPIIRFTKEGRFEDQGIFAVAMPSRTEGDDRAGAGNYEIRDFSLFLRYDDGRNRQVAFPGRGPALAGASPRDDRIFFGDVGLQMR